MNCRRNRERFAPESVRYERARIARELHNIIAHCVSVMVVQPVLGSGVACPGTRAGLDRIGELVRRAHLAGLAGDCRFLGDASDRLTSIPGQIIELRFPAAWRLPWRGPEPPGAPLPPSDWGFVGGAFWRAWGG